MSRESIEASVQSKLRQVGRAGLNILFPKEFEYYLLALELVSGNDTIDYFAWPILPDELREVHQEITQVRKTIGGVYSLKNSSFVPRQILIRGTFGRRFKILINRQPTMFAGFQFSLKNKKFTVTPPNKLENIIPQFSSFAKTGYGCIKVLESIKEKSKQLSGGKPLTLYLYNPILGNNYQVEITNFTHFQDKSEHNMVPGYQLQLTAIAPFDNVFDRGSQIKSAIKNLAIDAVQRKAQDLANNLRKVIKKA